MFLPARWRPCLRLLPRRPLLRRHDPLACRLLGRAEEVRERGHHDHTGNLAGDARLEEQAAGEKGQRPTAQLSAARKLSPRGSSFTSLALAARATSCTECGRCGKVEPGDQSVAEFGHSAVCEGLGLVAVALDHHGSLSPSTALLPVRRLPRLLIVTERGRPLPVGGSRSALTSPPIWSSLLLIRAYRVFRSSAVSTLTALCHHHALSWRQRKE